MTDSWTRQTWAATQVAPAVGDTVLEVGCGDGVCAAALCQAVGEAGRVLAVDRSGAAVAATRARLVPWLDEGRAQVAHGDVLDLALATGTVDHVVAVSLPSVWRSAHLGAEVWRVLRPGGALHVVEQSAGWHHPADVDAGVAPVLSTLAGYGYALQPPTVERLAGGWAVHARVVRP